jgi:phthalate 4,5-dioxygenase oxygenase subunit
VAAGGPALGRTEPHLPHAKIGAFEGVVPNTTDWRTLGVAAEELAAGGAEQVAWR